MLPKGLLAESSWPLVVMHLRQRTLAAANGSSRPPLMPLAADVAADRPKLIRGNVAAHVRLAVADPAATSHNED